jgi:hypothetical protein
VASKSAISPFGMVTVLPLEINILIVSIHQSFVVPAKLMTGNGAV